MPLPLLLLSSLAVSAACLVLGGAAVGAALARAYTRREQEGLRAAEERAHGLRVRALEASRLAAVAELGRAAAALQRQSLGARRKAPRRVTVAPRVGERPEVPAALELVPPPRVPEPSRPPAPPTPDDATLKRLVAAAEVRAPEPAGRAASWSIPLAPIPR